MPFVALMVKVYWRFRPGGGVPLMTPVVLLIDSQAGTPIRLNIGAGKPAAATGYVPGWCMVKVALAALVNLRPTSTLALPPVFSGVLKLGVKLQKLDTTANIVLYRRI